MKAVILCGGQSIRMGVDKGTLLWSGKRLANHAIDALKVAKTEIILSVNNNQRKQYEGLFNTYSIIPDDPSVSLNGPVKGILSVHRFYPTEDLIILACDTPLLSTHLVDRLIQSHQINPGYDVYLYSRDGQYEPLAGIYTTAALHQITQWDLPESYSGSGMKFLLSRLKVHDIQLNNQETNELNNFNTRMDLESPGM